MPSRICLFCSGPVRGRGEHVLPNWLQRIFDPQGPFTLMVNGVPEQRSDGSVRTLADHPRTMLRNVCDSAHANCNGWLGETFEVPGKPYVVEVLTGTARLDEHGTATFARWATKTLLLLSHPMTKTTGQLTARDRRWDEFPAQWLPQLRQTGLFPSDLSLWMAIHDPRNGGQLPAAAHIELPRHTFRNDGSAGGGAGGVTMIAFGLDDGRVLELTLVHHPLCLVRHPFEDAGLATRLWPDPPASLDMQAHPVLGPAGADQWRGLFMVGGGGFGIRPRHALELRAAPGTQAEPLTWPNEVCQHD